MPGWTWLDKGGGAAEGSGASVLGTFGERKALQHKLLKSVMEGRLERCRDQGLESPGDELSAECIGGQCWGFVCFLLRGMSVERCLGPNLTSVTILSNGRSKADSKKK